MHTPTHHRMALFAIATALCALFVFASCEKPMEDALIIYCYDSFASEWGTGPVVAKAFEDATGISVQLVAIGDGGQVLSRAVDEKDNPQADIILGVDNNLAQRAVDSGILRAYKPKGWETVSSDKVLDAQWHLTPYDWGAFAIIWDSDKLANPPASLEDLTKPEFAKKLILMDPRTSTPGLGFLAWIKAVYGEQMADYWKRLAPSVLTMAPGWDMGYGLFTKGEAPLVLSYTTSPAYHAEYETGGRYKALIFAEGHPIQIEGVGILKGAPHRKAAEAFMDFILSDAFQDAIPLANWMYPVVERALPASYQWAPKPTTLIKQDPAQLAGSVESALDALGGR